MEKTYITIVIHQECDNTAEGKTIYNAIKQKFADTPNMKVTANISTHIEPEPTPHA